MGYIYLLVQLILELSDKGHRTAIYPNFAEYSMSIKLTNLIIKKTKEVLGPGGIQGTAADLRILTL